jgi:hypothetical protein
MELSTNEPFQIHDVNLSLALWMIRCKVVEKCCQDEAVMKGRTGIYLGDEILANVSRFE